MGKCGFEKIASDTSSTTGVMCNERNNRELVYCGGGQNCKVFDVNTLEVFELPANHGYHSDGDLVTHPITGKIVFLGGHHTLSYDTGIHAEVLEDDNTWTVLPEHKEFPASYRGFTYAKGPHYTNGERGIFFFKGHFLEMYCKANCDGPEENQEWEYMGISTDDSYKWTGGNQFRGQNRHRMNGNVLNIGYDAPAPWLIDIQKDCASCSRDGDSHGG